MNDYHRDAEDLPPFLFCFLRYSEIGRDRRVGEERERSVSSPDPSHACPRPLPPKVTMPSPPCPCPVLSVLVFLSLLLFVLLSLSDVLSLVCLEEGVEWLLELVGRHNVKAARHSVWLRTDTAMCCRHCMFTCETHNVW